MVGPQVKQTRKRKRRYIHGFDGLRTIGVIGVILYHLRPELFRGGYLGVPIFMVVSGYLITDGLLIEFDRLSDFIRRLSPFCLVRRPILRFSRRIYCITCI